MWITQEIPNPLDKIPSYRKWVLVALWDENTVVPNPPKMKSNEKLKLNKMLKIFISKIRKYKQGQKYENKHLFPFAKHLRC